MPFYIQYDATDVFVAPTGLTRPVPYPPGHWSSPSIWFTLPGDELATVAKPRVGQTVDIRVRVDPNEGGAPQPVSTAIKVQAWLSDWITGNVGPGSVPLNGSTPGVGVKNPSGLVIDSTVPSPSARVAMIPWTPNVHDLLNPDAQGEGHMCITANAYLNVGTVEGKELPDIPAGEIYTHPRTEPHHAQRNIAIVPAGGGGGGGGASGTMFAMNPGKEEARFQLLIRPLRGRLGQVERELLLAHPFIRRVGGKPFDPKELPRYDEGVLGGPVERYELQRGGDLALGRDEIELHRSKEGLGRVVLRTKEDEGERLELTVPPTRSADDRVPFDFELQLADPSDAGAVEVVDVMQVGADNEVLGGVRLVLVTVRDEDLEWSEKRAAA